MSNRKLKSFFNIETLIIFIIAGCLVFLNIFTVNKLNELETARKDSVFLIDNLNFKDQEEFTREVTNYLGTSYKMIELYDINFDIMFQVQFSENYKETKNIKQYPELMNIISNNKNGQSSIEIDGIEQDVFFQWVTNEHGEQRLLVVYSAVKTISGLWMFSFVCWFIMILVFVLLIRLHSQNYKEHVQTYKDLTQRLRDGE